MEDIFEIFGEYSYFGIFLILIGVNAAPILMPPSWIILTSFYLLDPSLNVILLAVVGATGATMGRFFLKQHFFTRLAHLVWSTSRPRSNIISSRSR